MAEVKPWVSRRRFNWDPRLQYFSVIKCLGVSDGKKYQLLISKLVSVLHCHCATLNIVSIPLRCFQTWKNQVLSIFVPLKSVWDCSALPGLKSSTWSTAVGTESERTPIAFDIFQGKKKKPDRCSISNPSWQNWAPVKKRWQEEVGSTELPRGVMQPCQLGQAAGVTDELQSWNMTCLLAVTYSARPPPLLKCCLQVEELYC